MSQFFSVRVEIEKFAKDFTQEEIETRIIDAFPEVGTKADESVISVDAIAG